MLDVILSLVGNLARLWPWAVMAGCLLGCVPERPPTAPGTRPYLRASYRTYPTLQGTFSRFPADARTVPAHRKDPSDYGPYRIPDARITTGSLVDVALGIGITSQLGGGPLALRAGFEVAHLNRPGPSRFGSTTQRLNQYGEPERGSGTALAYYSVVAVDRLGVDPTLEFRLQLPYGVAFVGASRTLTEYAVQRGWDRYNWLQKLDNRSLGSAFIYEIFTGYSTGSFGCDLELLVGLAVQDEIRETALGRAVTSRYRLVSPTFGVRVPLAPARKERRE